IVSDEMQVVEEDPAEDDGEKQSAAHVAPPVRAHEPRDTVGEGNGRPPAQDRPGLDDAQAVEGEDDAEADDEQAEYYAAPETHVDAGGQSGVVVRHGVRPG